MLQIYILELGQIILRGYNTFYLPGLRYFQRRSCRVFCLHFGGEIFGVRNLLVTLVIHGLAIQSMFFSDMILCTIVLFRNF